MAIASGSPRASAPASASRWWWTRRCACALTPGDHEPMTIEFLKMHGAANDFVVVDHRETFLPEGASRVALVRALCDRRRGVGADGVLLLERDPELDYAMRYY